MKPYQFTFHATLERAEEEVDVKVTCRVESYAASVGFPGESCSERVVTIACTEHRGSPLTELELEFLHSQAVEQLCFH